MSNQTTTKIKVVLLGNGGVGKTTFLTRLRTGHFTCKYIPTLGVEVKPLCFDTNNGKVVLNCWDTAGQEKFGGLTTDYYEDASNFLIFFDIKSKTSFKHVNDWIKSIYKTVGERFVYISLVGLKGDGGSTTWKVTTKMFADFIDEFPNIKVHICSAKNNYNFEKPFLNIIRNVMGNDTHFVEESDEESNEESNDKKIV